MSHYMVSVVMITYNHENFIKEAIEGVLNQNLDFGDIELLVVDDLSPDNTKQVVEEYPEINGNVRLKYIRNSTNKGIIDNFFDALSFAKGKYIAICEGDDFWTDPSKLQQQIEFLEEDSSVAIASHNVQIVGQEFDEVISRPYYGNKPSGYYSTVDLIKGFKIPTNSIVFRNGLFDFANPPEWSRKIRSGDKFLYLMISQFGSIYYDEKVMACYRKHPQGAVGSYENWDLKKHTLIHQNQIFFWENFKRFFSPSYQKEIRLNISDEAFFITRRSIKEGVYSKLSLKYLLIAIKNDGSKLKQGQLELIPICKKHFAAKTRAYKIRFLVFGSKIKQQLLKLFGLV